MTSLRLRQTLWSMLASHSDGRLVSATRNFVHGLTKLLHAENHDFSTNGEARLLECLGPAAMTILDVGANRGAWALQARGLCPNATIYCFEIASETRERLRENVANVKGVEVLDFGLADRAGRERVKYYPEQDALTSLYDYPHPGPSVWKEEQIETGDAFVQDRRLRRIDLLKVDTEGADFRVLRGFAGTLSRAAISVIQFEYGYACILARALLLDFYEYLKPRGYHVGRLHTQGVEFREYELDDENFFGPNFVAVQDSHSALLNCLAGHRSFGRS